MLGVPLVAAVLSVPPAEPAHDVRANRPPVVSSERHSVQVGEFHRFRIPASDPDGDTLSYRVTGLPRTASFDPNAGTITWRPTEAEVGQHAFRIQVDDGTSTTQATFEVEVTDPEEALAEAEWSAWLMPGLGYSLYRPRRADTWGTFHGPRLELALGSFIHQTNSPGPSHGSLYLRVDLQRSTEDGVPTLFGYAGGFSLSFEKNPARRFLVPFYSLEVGGLVHDAIGHPLELSPGLGLHVVARPGFFATLTGGYRLLPTRMEALAGWHVSLLVAVGFW